MSEQFHTRCLTGSLVLKMDEEHGQVDMLPANAAVTGLLTTFERADTYEDIISMGALDDWLAAEGQSPLPMLVGHDHKQFIGEWGGFEVVEGVGDAPAALRATGDFFDCVRQAKEMYDLAAREKIRGISIGFKVEEYRVRRYIESEYDGWGWRFDRISLKEASLVLFPANDGASIEQVRSARMAQGLVVPQLAAEELESIGNLAFGRG